MDINNITDNAIAFLTETVDELLALGVVSGYMISAISGIGDVPIELPVGVLAYYFVKKQ